MRTQVTVRWSDEDAFGHVNNATFLTYLEEGRDRLFDELFGDTAGDFVLARVAIDYRAEITQRDGPVEVDVHVVGHGRSSVRTAEVITRGDGTVAAQAETVAVAVDHATGRSRELRAQELAALGG